MAVTAELSKSEAECSGGAVACWMASVAWRTISARSRGMLASRTSAMASSMIVWTSVRGGIRWRSKFYANLAQLLRSKDYTILTQAESFTVPLEHTLSCQTGALLASGLN